MGGSGRYDTLAQCMLQHGNEGLALASALKQVLMDKPGSAKCVTLVLCDEVASCPNSIATLWATLRPTRPFKPKDAAERLRAGRRPVRKGNWIATLMQLKCLCFTDLMLPRPSILGSAADPSGTAALPQGNNAHK